MIMKSARRLSSASVQPPADAYERALTELEADGNRRRRRSLSRFHKPIHDTNRKPLGVRIISVIRADVRPPYLIYRNIRAFGIS